MVLESMACGRPVVATRIPSLTEVVQEGRNGTLAEADDPAGLADAVRRDVDRRFFRCLRGHGTDRLRTRLARVCQQYSSLYGHGAVRGVILNGGGRSSRIRRDVACAFKTPSKCGPLTVRGECSAALARGRASSREPRLHSQPSPPS